MHLLVGNCSTTISHCLFFIITAAGRGAAGDKSIHGDMVKTTTVSAHLAKLYKYHFAGLVSGACSAAHPLPTDVIHTHHWCLDCHAMAVTALAPGAVLVLNVDVQYSHNSVVLVLHGARRALLAGIGRACSVCARCRPLAPRCYSFLYTYMYMYCHQLTTTSHVHVHPICMRSGACEKTYDGACMHFTVQHRAIELARVRGSDVTEGVSKVCERHAEGGAA